MGTRSYISRLEAEKRNYANCANTEDLPDIFHYWSNRHIRPRLKRFGFDSPKGMIRKYIREQAVLGDSGPLRFLSIGCGNCELEIELASEFCSKGHSPAVFDCLDLNAGMLERAGVAAAQHGVDRQINRLQCDFNEWDPSLTYDAVIASQALHHVLNLERLLTNIRNSLKRGGRLIVSDMIGRNGHQLWPEALDILDEFWCKLPPSYRFNNRLRRYEERFVNRNYSDDGFEGIRSQDILPVLLQLFQFELFVGFGNIINPFVDRSFGPNFDPAAPWDRDFIDQVHARDEGEMLRGHIKPTHMLAVLSNVLSNEGASAALSEPLSPESCVRLPRINYENHSHQSGTGPSPGIYNRGAWPHSSDRELEIACRRLSEAAQLIQRAEDKLEDREAERDERTAWALRLDKENAALTELARKLEQDLRERTLWAMQLEQNLQERSAWAAQLAKELAEQTAAALQLEKQVEERTAWALRLRDELEERTAWALQLRGELERSAWVRSLAHRFNRLVHLPRRMARFLAKSLGFE